MKNKTNGITLIALVITIIVLLILAGVSIAMLTGNNGILTQAQTAKEKTTKAEEEEKVNMAVMGSSLTDNGYADVLDTEDFTNELDNQFGENGYSILEDNEDGSFLISINDTQRKYYINDDKTVINSDNIVEIGADKFANFRDDVNAGNSYEGKVVLLTENVDLQSQEWEPIGVMDSNTDSKNPETGDNKPFKGIFDGGNHTIKNLKISSTYNKFNGLFSFVVDGTIRNITIGENSEITGNSGAGVIGFLYGFKGNISNCINYANTNSGGIAKQVAGQHTIYNCKNYGSINSNSTTAGGIVGGSNGTDWQQFANVSNKIINCGNYGSVNTSGNYCGGIVGILKGDIINCCNKAEIQGGFQLVGGIAGNLSGGFTIKNCYNVSNVSANKLVGGILGASNNSEGISNIINCYSIGNITGTELVGDIEGYPENIVSIKIKDNLTNCYIKDDTFTAKDLGDAFVDNPENANQPLLYWEVEENKNESY